MQVRFVTNGGIAFVEFGSTEEATKALEIASNELYLGGRQVRPAYAAPRGEGNQNRGDRTQNRGDRFQNGGDRFQNRGDRFQNRGEGGAQYFKTPKPENGDTFFLGGLPNHVEEKDVKAAFPGCNIASIRWVERDGQFKGVAFVEFADTKAADKAAELANAGVTICNRVPRIDWAANASNKKRK